MADIADLKRMALNWLSRRDYSEAQLSQRLSRQGGEADDIAKVIAWCKAENYLDQQRFISMLVRSRVNKGYGLGYIVQECRQQNISREQVLQCAAELEIDWFALALQLYQKKYGQSAVTEYKDKFKRMAYMQRRGFSNEQIQFAINQTE
ncbi:regulatory protein [Rheinheimera pacifica]|uniref:Regulatory protein RecX n=1 Tax=Rheinheimera pacifica TaxID=173990 RepID=A0A1H6NIT0_9GAMM|nr:regulatory protein RecX [Rheinheimera pacifica]SEI13256.1 regulatory protein [Rheinheimera pacifica]